MTASYYHSQDISSIHSTRKFPGFQLPYADIVHQTEPQLFDELPVELLTEDHLILRNWDKVGDRMLVANILPVSRNARLVASVLLWHGWSSYPTREWLCELADISDYSVITRGITELEKAGFVTKRKRVQPGRGLYTNQVTFDGRAVCRRIVEKDFPIFGQLAARIVQFHAADGAESRSDSQSPRGLFEEGRSDSQSPRLPEVRSPEWHTVTPGVTHSHHNLDDLIDIYTDPGFVDQSINGTRGDSQSLRVESSEGRGIGLTPRPSPQVCPSCKAGPYAGPRCLSCEYVFDAAPQPVGPVGVGPEAGGASPAWFEALVRQVPPHNLPLFQQLDEDRQLHAWSDEVMADAAAKYAEVYADQRVSEPEGLFRQIAVNVAKRHRRGAGRGYSSRSSGVSGAKSRGRR